MELSVVHEGWGRHNLIFLVNTNLTNTLLLNISTESSGDLVSGVLLTYYCRTKPIADLTSMDP